MTINDSILVIKYRVFEDNSSALEMATIHKFNLRTKYINVKLHYF